MDQMNNYKLLMPFQNENAGFSRWTYATRFGEEFFIKEFMNPIYPDETTLTETLRVTKINNCRKFEMQKSNLYRTINEVSDGNLIRVFEFFRCDSHYYIAMPKVAAEKVSFEEIASLPLEDRILLCRTAARSIKAIHSAHIVHSDIKDTNVLLHRSATGKLVTKIIDYDCSFFEFDPPQNENDLGGDQIYLSPEACLFFCGEETKLTCKMDIFSLGLLFHQYLTGKLPDFDHGEYDYAHEAVLDGNTLEVSKDINSDLRMMIQNMLEADPDSRIDINGVYEVLNGYYSAAPYKKPAEYNPWKETVTPVWNDPADMKEKKEKTPESFFHQAGNL